MSRSGDGTWDKPLRSKGLLPAIGVGAAVYFVTGVVSLSTLGLVGVGAGVGYGVGSWLADKYQEKRDQTQQGGTPLSSLPQAMQVSLQQWQAFLSAEAAKFPGQQLTPDQVEQVFVRFEQCEPLHASAVRGFGASASGSAAGAASSPTGTPVIQGPGVTIVPTAAAEV